PRRHSRASVSAWPERPVERLRLRQGLSKISRRLQTRRGGAHDRGRPPRETAGIRRETQLLAEIVLVCWCRRSLHSRGESIKQTAEADFGFGRPAARLRHTLPAATSGRCTGNFSSTASAPGSAAWLGI